MKKPSGNTIISIVALCFFAAVIGVVWILGLAGLDSEPDKETGEIRQLALRRAVGVGGTGHEIVRRHKSGRRERVAHGIACDRWATREVDHHVH
ncbi:MAG: hypothetical protein IKI41_04215, partial [Clostridia bacterium]|nr:hypothetical protein [Clostridia bacterium]